MRIGIDYHAASTHASGVGRYARELVRALVQLDERPDLALYDVGRAARTIDERALGLTIGDPRVVRLQRDWSRRALRLAPLGLCAADRLLGGVDLFHHVLVDGPRVRRARQTIAIAALPAEGTGEAQRLRAALARMDGILVFSAHYHHEVSARFGIPPGRIHRVAVGCEHWRRELSSLPVRDEPPILLVLGALRAARRHVAILRALEVLQTRGTEVRLLLVGAHALEGEASSCEREFRRALDGSCARDRVTIVSAAREREMPELVARARVFVHLDDDTGTPVTPLEAFAVGVPVVASRIPAFEEALGELASFVDNREILREPARLADAIALALASASDENARDARMQLARAFTWERCARETLAAWRAIVARAL